MPVAAPTANPGPAGHEGPPTGGLYPYSSTSTGAAGGGFAGTPAQSATAAAIAGIKPNSAEWVNAVTSANANGGVLPTQANPTSPTVQSSPFDSDPGYAAARAAEQLGIPSVNNDLNNLIAQRIVAYGDPSLAAQAGFGLDPQAAAFARQNYLSGNGQLARLDKAHAQARQAIINQLAAHGLIDSGDTGYQIGNADQTYGNNVYDAQQSALADILGYRNNAQTQRSQLHQAVIGALENAYHTGIDHPGLYDTPPPPVTTTPPATHGALGTAAARKVTGGAREAAVQVLRNPYVTGQKRFG